LNLKSKIQNGEFNDRLMKFRKHKIVWNALTDYDNNAERTKFEINFLNNLITDNFLILKNAYLNPFVESLV